MKEEPTPHFNAGDAFKFIKEKEGRSLPKRYVLEKLKKGDLEDLSIPEDLGSDPELILVYKILYAQEELTSQELQQRALKLDLSDSNLKSLPSGLNIASLNISRTPIEQLPSDIKIKWRLNADDCTYLKEIPDGLCRSDIMGFGLSGCVSLKDIPKGFRARSLWINGCTSIESLPDGLCVIGSMSCCRCASLGRLPASLKIGEYLFIDDRTGIFSHNVPHRGNMAKAMRIHIEEDLKGEVSCINYGHHNAIDDIDDRPIYWETSFKKDIWDLRQWITSSLTDD